MRKFLLTIFIFMTVCSEVFATKLPQDVVRYINTNVPGADIRFDGVVIYPDSTVYLPLLPSLFSDIEQLKIKKTFPENQSMADKPDIIIFNNDFVLLKVFTDENGNKTVKYLKTPPVQVRTGLLPQDMLVPSGLKLPENIKGIIGNLKIDTKGEDVIKKTDKESYEVFLDDVDIIKNQECIPQLKNKILFAKTNYSKNIQVMEPGKSLPIYSLAQKSIPVDIESVDNGKFLLVTSYERPLVDIVSVADSRFIKQINLPTLPEEIVVDANANKAYITSPTASMLYVIDLKTMALTQKIRINGYCEKLILRGNKIFYVDKLQNEIWAIELDNEYLLKDIGKFPNVSALEFSNNELFVTSRTKGRIAIVDYDTLELNCELSIANKPIALQQYDDYLYILGAQNNVIQVLNVQNHQLVKTIELGTGGFSTGFRRIDNSPLAVIVDVKNNKYSIIDLSAGKILKTYSVNVPISDIIITNRIKLFD